MFLPFQSLRNHRPLAILGASLIVCGPALAQEPAGGFLGRGLSQLLGKSDRGSGSYVSPSGIPGDGTPSASDVGLAPPRALERLEPIALPEIPSLDTPKFDLPTLPAYAPDNRPLLDIIRPRKTLVLEAKLRAEGEAIPSGLVWRLFAPIAGLDGKLPLAASATGGTAVFEVPKGEYLLHVGFGSAGVTKRVAFTGEQTREVVILGAGGLKLGAMAAGNIPIPADKLSFDIFTDAPVERDRQLVVGNVPPGKTVRLNAGAYHVVSKFGSVNATIRANLTVEPGKITEATLQHQAAILTMKLVRETGGEAIADTAWTISNTSGDVLRESVGAFSSMVLAEGDYLIVARNKDRVYRRDFRVDPGVNTDVEVLTSDLVVATDGAEGSGD